MTPNERVKHENPVRGNPTTDVKPGDATLIALADTRRCLNRIEGFVNLDQFGCANAVLAELTRKVEQLRDALQSALPEEP